MFGLFKKKPPQDGITAEFGEAFKKAIQFHSVERRAHPRLRYPPTGPIGALPTITFEGKQLQPNEMSYGGFSVKSNPLTDAKPDTKYSFEITWPRSGKKQLRQADFLRSTIDNQQFKFADTNAEFAAEFTAAFKPAFRAKQSEQVSDEKFPAGQGISELWISPQADFLRFQSGEGKKVEQIITNLNDTRCQFDRKAGFTGVTKSPAGIFTSTGVQTPPSYAEDILIYIMNLTRPTPRVLALAQDIIKVYFQR
jgi:hypothetical protein